MDIQTLATYTMPVQCQAMDQIEQGHLVMHQQHKKACYATGTELRLQLHQALSR